MFPGVWRYLRSSHVSHGSSSPSSTPLASIHSIAATAALAVPSRPTPLPCARWCCSTCRRRHRGIPSASEASTDIGVGEQTLKRSLLGQRLAIGTSRTTALRSHFACRSSRRHTQRSRERGAIAFGGTSQSHRARGDVRDAPRAVEHAVVIRVRAALVSAGDPVWARRSRPPFSVSQADGPRAPDAQEASIRGARCSPTPIWLSSARARLVRTSSFRIVAS